MQRKSKSKTRKEKPTPKTKVLCVGGSRHGQFVEVETLLPYYECRLIVEGADRKAISIRETYNLVGALKGTYPNPFACLSFYLMGKAEFE